MVFIPFTFFEGGEKMATNEYTISKIELPNGDICNIKDTTYSAGTGIGISGTTISNTGVTGVKGNSESSYRTGQVNLTAAHIGAITKYETGNTQHLVRPAGLNGVNDVTYQTLINDARANRLAFLPADQIIIEKTTDGGATWTDAGCTDAQKQNLFSEKRQSYISIPQINGEMNINCGLRVTVTAMKYNVPADTSETQKYNYWNSNYVASVERYCQIKNMYFWVSSAYNSIKVKVERATGAASTNWIVAFDKDDYGMTGWSGNDIISFSQSMFGGGKNQTGNYWNWRFTFMTRGPGGSTTLDNRSLNIVQSIAEIRGYGDTWWTKANEYMASDHMYSWDHNKNVTFPATVTATSFSGSLNASNLTGSIADVRLSSNVVLLNNAQTITGQKTFSNDILVTSPDATTTRQVRFTVAANDYGRIASGGTASNSGWLEVATADDGNEPIYARQYNGTYTTVKRTATLLDASGNTEFPVQVTAPKFIGALEGNASTATAFSANKEVKLTGDVTGSASSTGGWSIATTIGEGKVTNAMLAGSIANGKLANSSIKIGNKTISLGGTATLADIGVSYPVTSVAGNTGAITADTLRTSLGLSNAMHFLGVTTTNISTGTPNTTATVSISGSNVTATAGDVVLYGSQEYVWGNSKWNLLGDESSYKVKQTAKSDPTASSTTSTTFIDTISQDANGVITATKKTLPSYTDTKNTAGSTNSASKLYLIGATTQAANPTTNSYQYTYTNNGLLSALELGLNLNGTEKAHLEWNDTDQSIDFVFN